MCQLHIFIKFPTPGKVKTRIAADSSHETAAKIFKSLVEILLSKLSKSRKIIHYSGAEEKKFKDWLGDEIFCQQSLGNLGEKLTFASKNHFRQQKEPMVIIGSDCPEIDDALIEETNDLLKKYDVVIGPADDGGYYLIAFNSFYPELFENITWSTSKVLEETLAIIDSLNLSCKLLERKTDVDTWNQVPDELKYLKEQ